MYHYSLATTLTESQSPEWEKLMQQELGSNVHSDRKRGFLLARQALLTSLQQFHSSVSISDLKLLNYHQVPRFSQYTISLSHTKLCGAAIVAQRKDFRSVGIDVEDEKRVVKDAIRERIAHPQDENLRNIELWCAKEAVFKAIMNTGEFENPIEFGSIQILSSTWCHSPSGLEGEWKLELTKPFVIATALLRN